MIRMLKPELVYHKDVFCRSLVSCLAFLIHELIGPLEMPL